MRYEAEKRSLDWGDPYLLAAFAAGALLRVFRLGDAPLWLDEVTSVEWIRLGWFEMTRAALTDNHPPLYFLMLKGWSEVVGESPWLLRLPSAALSWLCIPLAAALAATVAGRGAVRWAAWLTALSPQLLHHGQEARMYTLLAVLGALHVLLLLRFLVRPDGSRGARLGPLFVLVAAAMAATHHYAIFFLCGELAALALFRPRPVADWLPGSAGAAATGFIGLLAALFLAQQEGGESYELGLLAIPGAVWSMLSGYALLPSSEELHAQGWRAALPYLPFALAAAPAVLFLAWKGLAHISLRASLTLVVVLAASVSAPFVVAWILQVGINPRYLIAATPLLIVVLASATAAGAFSSRLAASAVALVMAVGAALHLSSPGHGREDVASAARWLQDNVAPDETILVTSEEMEILARFHWPERRWRLYPPRRTVVGHDEAARVAEEMPFDATRVIYVIGREWLSDPDAALRKELQRRYQVCPGTEVRGIQILCFGQRGDRAAGKQTVRRGRMKGGPS